MEEREGRRLHFFLVYIGSGAIRNNVDRMEMELETKGVKRSIRQG